MSYAAETSVSVEKTRYELETLLSRFGASAFGYLCEDERAVVMFKLRDRAIRFHVPLPSRTEDRFIRDKRFSYYVARSVDKQKEAWEQACRASWRGLLLIVKAKLVAVEQKVRTFEEEFLSDTVLPNGLTVGQEMLPRIQESISSGQMPTFALTFPAA